MSGGDGEVAESLPDVLVRKQSLLRLAFVLAGDRGHAQDLVRTALMTTHRRVAGLRGALATAASHDRQDGRPRKQSR